MIYGFKIPKYSLDLLTNVLYLQMRLIRYAATTKVFDKGSCERYFKSYKRFEGCYKEIADWVFKGRKKRELLEKIFDEPLSKEKLKWSSCLFREALVLLHKPTGFITKLPDSDLNDWQRAGAEFLRKFYSEYLGKGLPENFLGKPGLNTITKAELKEEFFTENIDNLTVCPICENSNVGTQLDHFLPISLYPHLSCHPYNLVPICGDCNSLENKGNADILQKDQTTRRKLTEILLPYRSKGLFYCVYPEVVIDGNSRLIKDATFKSRPGFKLVNYIEAYSKIYGIPERWKKRNLRTIGNTLYSDLKSTFKAAVSPYHPYLHIFAVRDCLDDLLVDWVEKQGQEPFAFLTTWWLASLINQSVDPVVFASPPVEWNMEDYPFLKEISDWLGQGAGIQHPIYMSTEKRDRARSLRKRLAP